MWPLSSNVRPMTRFLAALILLLSISGASRAQDSQTIDITGLSEASMNFDQEGVGPFLHELSRSFTSGLDPAQAEQLTDSIDALAIEQTGSWEFKVVANGKTERLVIVAFKDDVDAPDLAFYSSPELSARIDEQLEFFARAQGW
jgi:hypothetical protein